MQSREQIYQTLADILVEEFEIEADDISLEANLYTDLDLDSIDAIDLVIKLRDITNEKIEPEVFKLVRTVEDVVNEIEKLTLAK
ncbi:MAG: acyl carrier protein [Moritella sp.]|uniref:acyl carrier protein n=1 Tax=unclassified Moritella TaxID=2637987 RepID=UPI000156858D|nr:MULTISPECIES: acyl carrier protein [unclassified Moritella]EDM68730.1 Acyl carrier protein [Moritella sp. PE36]MBL1416411.1 acyl carrier protein [Moritella sp.]NQZ93596.1 acyl carrier protein [Moritella sp.]